MGKTFWKATDYRAYIATLFWQCLFNQFFNFVGKTIPQTGNLSYQPYPWPALLILRMICKKIHIVLVLLLATSFTEAQNYHAIQGSPYAGSIGVHNNPSS